MVTQSYLSRFLSDLSARSGYEWNAGDFIAEQWNYLDKACAYDIPVEVAVDFVMDEIDMFPLSPPAQHSLDAWLNRITHD